MRKHLFFVTAAAMLSLAVFSWLKSTTDADEMRSGGPARMSRFGYSTPCGDRCNSRGPQPTIIGGDRSHVTAPRTM
jgi:hypothetical protein